MSAMGGHFRGWRILDLFAGSGALGLECLSRGAEHVTFVEHAASSLAVLRRNVALVGAEDRCTIVHSDVFAWLQRHAGGLVPLPDAALADPPYDQGHGARLLERFVSRPFAKALWLEHASHEDLPPVAGLRQRRYGDTTISHLDAEA